MAGPFGAKMKRFLPLSVSVLSASLMFSIAGFAQPAPAKGIPVNHEITRSTCGGCHRVDDQGRMSRISYIRMTPEGWQETIKRMMRNHAVAVQPAAARAIVKYLSSNHGLAPEEARPAFYELEKRMVRERVPDELQPCIRCHSLGRVLMQRRNRDEWQLLTNMHLAMFPLTEFQAFSVIPDPNARQPRVVPVIESPERALDSERAGPGAGPATEPPRNAGPDDFKDPVEKALDYLGKTYPMETPEFAAWRANARVPRLEGTWTIEAYLPGKGRGFGQMVIERDTAADEFKTRATIEFPDGDKMTRTGKAILYAGYSWRGSSTDSDGRIANTKELREVMMLASDLDTLRGRWYAGAYEEFGPDVILRRARRDPLISGVDTPRLLAGKAATVKVFGVNFPTDLRAEEVDFGPGVRVSNVRATTEVVTVDVSVGANAPVGYRDVLIRGVVGRRATAVADRIDYLRVIPEQAMARLGGAGRFPKGYAQFDAIAYHVGADGRSGTADDLELGRVNADWSVEEFRATVNDDDIKYVGRLDAKGFFTPNVEGPNPERNHNTNNYGDVRVVATYTGDGAAKAVKGTAHLVVTVPLYMKWLQLEVLP